MVSAPVAAMAAAAVFCSGMLTSLMLLHIRQRSKRILRNIGIQCEEKNEKEKQVDVQGCWGVALALPQQLSQQPVGVKAVLQAETIKSKPSESTHNIHVRCDEFKEGECVPGERAAPIDAMSVLECAAITQSPEDHQPDLGNSDGEQGTSSDDIDEDSESFGEELVEEYNGIGGKSSNPLQATNTMLLPVAEEEESRDLKADIERQHNDEREHKIVHGLSGMLDTLSEASTGSRTTTMCNAETQTEHSIIRKMRKSSAFSLESQGDDNQLQLPVGSERSQGSPRSLRSPNLGRSPVMNRRRSELIEKLIGSNVSGQAMGNNAVLSALPVTVSYTTILISKHTHMQSI